MQEIEVRPPQSLQLPLTHQRRASVLNGSSSASSSNSDECSPMDLSSGGILNAKKLAAFVKAQHFVHRQEENETHTDSETTRLPKKRPWPELELDLSQVKEQLVSSSKRDQHEDISSSDHFKPDRTSPDSGPLWPGTRTPDSGSLWPGTPKGGREVKKRRLDELLSKKFSMEAGHVTDHVTRRDSQESTSSGEQPKKHRRKQSHPTSPTSSHLTLRPPSELYTQPPSSDLYSQPSPSSHPSPSSPQRKKKLDLASLLDGTSHSQQAAENEQLKGQLLQLQLAQAALLSSASQPNPDLLKTAALFGGQNPLLYYGYYAQMLQGLQTQQQKLLEQLAIKQSSESIKSLLAPKTFSSTKEFKVEPDRRSPYSPLDISRSSHAHSPSPSPRGAGRFDEPRRRAPRALTGRYVRTGTGASPRVLAVLRKKIEERIKLKELLGENSHLYFGALNKQGKKKAKK